MAAANGWSVTTASPGAAERQLQHDEAPRTVKQVGLRAKIIRVFALQLLLISLATLLGVYFTNSLIRDSLMRGALDGEAAHYWTLYSENTRQPLPNTDNMVGYMARGADYTNVPEAVYRIGSEPGYHRGSYNGDEQIVHVSDRGDARLFLVFDNESVSDLALFFGIVPLTVVLLLVYGLMLFAYRMSQRAISPIVRLANYLENFQFGETQSPALELGPLRSQADTEVATMIEALDHFTDRVDAFIERERIFTRDASHELRTPVAVFKASLDLLEKNQQRPESELRAFARMRRTLNDMEGLIGTMLMLASEELPPSEPLLVNDIVHHQTEQLSTMAGNAGNTLTVAENAQLTIEAPLRVVQILLTNLIRNAISYTRDGSVVVTIDADSVSVEDSGIGMTTEELKSAFDPFFRGQTARDTSKGHGLGLSIVKRLVDQFGWSLNATSEPGSGTRINVRFAQA